MHMVMIIRSNKDSACNYQRTRKEGNLHYGYILENYFQFLDNHNLQHNFCSYYCEITVAKSVSHL